MFAQLFERPCEGSNPRFTMNKYINNETSARSLISKVSVTNFAIVALGTATLFAARGEAIDERPFALG